MWNQNEQICVKECPAATPARDWNTIWCTECASQVSDKQKTPVWDGEKCVACPAEKPNWDPYRKECFAKCPEDKPYWGWFDANFKHCYSCRTIMLSEDGRWNPNTQKCVTGCPAETPAAELDGWCQTCAQAHPERPYWDPREEKCVSVCRDFSVDGVCATCYADDPAKPYWDAATGECRACADVFPDNPRWDPNLEACVSDCIQPLYVPDGIQCLTCGD